MLLTNRPLKPNEVFEVRLDKIVTKWTGSIEIGVTTHSPNCLELPSTMTNVSDKIQRYLQLPVKILPYSGKFHIIIIYVLDSKWNLDDDWKWGDA